MRAVRTGERPVSVERTEMMRNPEICLRTENLTRIYDMGGVRVTALRGVSLSLEGAAFMTVTGASGSGKSTLLNLLGGLDTPTSGTIEFRGGLISSLGRGELARYRRFGVGIIFQAFNLISARTALENVELPLVFSGLPKKERRARAADLLDRVGLGARRSHRPAELSGGEQQRVAIARALANRPRILLADEPTGNLDSRTSRETIELLSSLNGDERLTILLVTHEEALAREFSTEVVRLKDGAVESRERLR